MKIAIVGSRDYPNMRAVADYVNGLPEGSEVVSGGARGVDGRAEWVARARGLPVRIFPADWNRYGKSAGYRRNREIVEHADRVVAFWDGKSRGTKHTIDIARDLGKPVEIYQP